VQKRRSPRIAHCLLNFWATGGRIVSRSPSATMRPATSQGTIENYAAVLESALTCATCTGLSGSTTLAQSRLLAITATVLGV
jgi:hypothetical protein